MTLVILRDLAVYILKAQFISETSESLRKKLIILFDLHETKFIIMEKHL